MIKTILNKIRPKAEEDFLLKPTYFPGNILIANVTDVQYLEELVSEYFTIESVVPGEYILEHDDISNEKIGFLGDGSGVTPTIKSMVCTGGVIEGSDPLKLEVTLYFMRLFANEPVLRLGFRVYSNTFYRINE